MTTSGDICAEEAFSAQIGRITVKATEQRATPTELIDEVGSAFRVYRKRATPLDQPLFRASEVIMKLRVAALARASIEVCMPLAEDVLRLSVDPVYALQSLGTAAISLSRSGYCTEAARLLHRALAKATAADTGEHAGLKKAIASYSTLLKRLKQTKANPTNDDRPGEG